MGIVTSQKFRLGVTLGFTLAIASVSCDYFKSHKSSAPPSQTPGITAPPLVEETAPQGKKASIAVLDLDLVLSRGGGDRHGLITLRDKMVTAIGGTRKFKVVERSRVDDMMKEFDLTKAGFTDKSSAVKAGKMIGSDFLVMGTLDEYGIGVTVKPIPYTSRADRILSGRMSGDLRIVDSRTGEIVATWQQVATHSVNTEFDGPPGQGFTDDLIREFVEKAALYIADTVYPPKVVQVAEPGLIYINRGKDGSFTMGDTLDVFAVGSEIKDADTGDILGTNDTKVGTAVVKEIQQRMTIATLKESNVAVNIGMKVRIATGNKHKKAEDSKQPNAPKLAW
ncbi:MAG: hypothetical protein IPP78_15390 [Holophagaceae bacterium]|nr:hypothetical protein [Holophagaceae bacterium]